MNWLWWLLPPAIILLLLFLPITLHVFYDGEFKMTVRVLFIRINIPLDKKPDKKKKKKKGSKHEQVVTDGTGFAGQLKHIKELVISIRERVLKAFIIKKLKVSVSVATGDPCSTALLFGTINSLFGVLLTVVEHYTVIRRKKISVTADYSEDTTRVTFDAVIKTFLLKLLICLILMVSDGTIKTKK